MTQAAEFKQSPCDLEVIRTDTMAISIGSNLFMPPDRMIGGILFLSCLFVCLSVCCQL